MSQIRTTRPNCLRRPEIVVITFSDVESYRVIYSSNGTDLLRLVKKIGANIYLHKPKQKKIGANIYLHKPKQNIHTYCAMLVFAKKKYEVIQMYVTDELGIHLPMSLSWDITGNLGAMC